jgi:hypothetical protein
MLQVCVGITSVQEAYRPPSLNEIVPLRYVVMNGIARYWGYLAFIVLITAWWTHAFGPAALIVLSLLVTAYFLFQAPVWCGAVNRDGTLCRRNASGLLLGCAYRQHKWQKLKMTIVPHTWRQLNRGLWASPRDGVNTLAALGGVVSAAAATVTLLVQH